MLFGYKEKNCMKQNDSIHLCRSQPNKEIHDILPIPIRENGRFRANAKKTSKECRKMDPGNITVKQSTGISFPLYRRSGTIATSETETWPNAFLLSDKE